MDKINKAAELILKSKKLMALTGAGISTESGIPDFRSEKGYYSSMDPMRALSREILIYEPTRFYSEGYKILEDLQGKKPNDGHFALAELERMGVLTGIVTQNIDNLHHFAGSKKVYEVHGESRSVSCMSCGKTYGFHVLEEKVKNHEIPPRCRACGGTLRPNVVMFGDAMPDDFYEAMEEINETDTLLVVGSSLQVAPVNMIPRYVDNLIIINRDPTPEDKNAAFVFHDEAGKVLRALVEKIKELKA
ncbi:putative NAD-dependent deacetylase [Clostridiales bacterium KA00134]|nr:putative NAD-dependent deacetylase [Clostridiales bacterium KA00134]